MTTAETRQINVLATMQALPGQEKKLSDLLDALSTEIRSEPGNVRFVAYEMKDRKGFFVCEEIYKDQTAFEAHMATEHGKVFNKTITPIVEGGASKVYFLGQIA